MVNKAIIEKYGRRMLPGNNPNWEPSPVKIVSACCRAPIKSYIPVRHYSYRTSPDDPVPYCTECGAEDPEEIEEEEEE